MRKFLFSLAAMLIAATAAFAQSAAARAAKDDTRTVVSSVSFTGFKGFIKTGMTWDNAAQDALAAQIVPETEAPYYWERTMQNLDKWDEVTSDWVRLQPDDAPVLTAGKYRYYVTVRIDGENGTKYRMPYAAETKMTATVDGESWETDDNDYITVEDTYSCVWIYAPEFELKEIDPAVANAQAELAALVSEMNYLYNFAKEFMDETDLAPYKGVIEAADAMAKKEDATLAEVNGEILIASTAFSSAVSNGMDVLKSETKTGFNSLLETGDSDACKKLVKDACDAVDELTWDFSKSATENLGVIDPVTNYNALINLKEALRLQREKEKEKRTIYLNIGEWSSSSDIVEYFVHTWDGLPDFDVKMELVEGNLYKADIPAGNKKIMFVRVAAGLTAIPWDTNDLLNKTCEKDIPADHDCLIITGYDDDKSCDSENWRSGGEWIDSDAKFYISGNAALIEDAGSTATEWASDAIKSTTEKYTLSLKKDKEYKLKVTNGSWTNAFGFSRLINIPQGVIWDDDDNLCFKLDADGDVEIWLDKDEYNVPGIRITGTFHYEVVYNYDDGYYIITPDWTLDNIVGSMEENPEEKGEYMGGLFMLKAGDSFKVVEVKDDKIVKWFPDGMGGEFVLPAELTGDDKVLYFRPEGNEAWKSQHASSFFWVATYVPTGVETAESQKSKVEGRKLLRDGQLLIIRNGVLYNAQGAVVE